MDKGWGTVNDLVIYKNELKNSNPARYKVIGIVTMIIISEELFERNVDIRDFIIFVFDENIFNDKYKEYVMSSRTLIVARTVRLIRGLSDKDYIDFKRKVYKYIDAKITNPDKKNIFDGWM